MLFKIKSELSCWSKFLFMGIHTTRLGTYFGTKLQNVFGFKFISLSQEPITDNDPDYHEKIGFEIILLLPQGFLLKLIFDKNPKLNLFKNYCNSLKCISVCLYQTL
jgi:hypothetical protein